MEKQATPCRESFVFYRSFYYSIERLPDDVQLALFRAVVRYGLDQGSPDFSGVSQQPFVEAIFAGIRPQLDANYKRFLNGNGGGCPQGIKKPSMIGNQNASKKQNRNETETKPNVNDNDNENENENKRKKPERELVLPFQDPKFIDTWKMLRSQPKWKGKTYGALKMALAQLSQFDVRFSVSLMEAAIAGNYQGVVFNDTGAKYEQWKRSNPQHSLNTGGEFITDIGSIYK